MTRAHARHFPTRPRARARIRAHLMVGACLALCPFLQACTTQLAELRLAAADHTEDWPLLVLEPDVEARACRGDLLHLIPLGGVRRPLQTAIEEAIAKAPDAQLLTNLRVDLETLDLVLYSRRCIRVRGVAARRARVIHVH